MKPDQTVPPAARPATSPTKAPLPFNGLLDPLPLPEVSESDTDTAWGLWEETLDALDGKPKPDADAPPIAAPGFEPTQPVGLDGEPTPD
jgi:hypothetical protein